MFGPYRILIDIVAGVALLLALLLVFIVDRLTSRSAVTNLDKLEVSVLKNDGADQPGVSRNAELHMAVTPTHRMIDLRTKKPILWDDMGSMLKKMGKGYQDFDTMEPTTLAANPAALDRYDVLFLTCAPKEKEITTALVRFVERGGILYASDWRYDDVAAAFPDVVDWASRGEGTRQNVTAEVVDQGLKDFLDTATIELRFNLSRWKTAAFLESKVTVLIKGKYQRQLSETDSVGVAAEAPLLVKFQSGKGTVIFTSFHNEAQNSAMEKKLLEYLVFTLVVADIDAKVTTSIRQAGFAPQKSNLLSAPKENPCSTRTYQNRKRGPLRFTLGFRNARAKLDTLELTLTSPGKKSFTWKGSSTVTLEVPDAEVGEWTYTVTALNLPYENFPFTVTVSEKK